MSYKLDKKIVVIYYVTGIIISLIPAIIVIATLRDSILFWAWIFLAGLFFVFFGIKLSEEDVMIRVLNNLFDEKAPKNNIVWKNEEFDLFVGEDLLKLYEDHCHLFDSFFTCNSCHRDDYSDYSFLLLPMAKVYEGVLKKILVKTGLVSKSELKNNPGIPIGRYFNPSGNPEIFSKLRDKSRDKAVPHVIYSTYQECRNNILHHDVYRDNSINSFEEAIFYQNRIEDAIDKAYMTFCKK